VTSRIYYTDPYCRRFDAMVTKAFVHEGRPAALLDRTAFYPTSGGQPFDTGQLIWAGNANGASAADEAIEERRGPYASAVDVIDTMDLDEDVIHIVSAPLTEGVAVRGEIDWTRRFDHMQQHTGQHVLSAAFDRLFENRTVSFHMGSDLSTIDLQHETSWEQIARAVGEANRIIWEDREVAIRFVSSDHAATLPLRKEPARGGTLRLVEVKDFDLSACGGTHVSRTGAIGSLVVTAAEKFKAGMRITFACGGRAVRAFQALREAVSGSVRLLSVLPHELPDAIERTQTEAKELRRTLKKFQDALASHEAVRLVEASRAGGANKAGEAGGASKAGEAGGAGEATSVMVEALDGWDANGLKAIATHITAQTRAAVALFSTGSPVAVVIARSIGVTVDAAATLRTLTERFGGRGGGKSDLAQGGGLAGSVSDIVAVTRHMLRSATASK
jgi:alanyl-tRNA synthetase